MQIMVYCRMRIFAIEAAMTLERVPNWVEDVGAWHAPTSFPFQVDETAPGIRTTLKVVSVPPASQTDCRSKIPKHDNSYAAAPAARVKAHEISMQ
jgi:hypothetical protein